MYPFNAHTYIYITLRVLLPLFLYSWVKIYATGYRSFTYYRYLTWPNICIHASFCMIIHGLLINIYYFSAIWLIHKESQVHHIPWSQSSRLPLAGTRVWNSFEDCSSKCIASAHTYIFSHALIHSCAACILVSLSLYVHICALGPLRIHKLLGVYTSGHYQLWLTRFLSLHPLFPIHGLKGTWPPRRNTNTAVQHQHRGAHHRA